MLKGCTNDASWAQTGETIGLPPAELAERRSLQRQLAQPRGDLFVESSQRVDTASVSGLVLFLSLSFYVRGRRSGLEGRATVKLEGDI